MSFADYATQILGGGLPAVLDAAKSKTGQGDTAPERTAPSGTRAGTEPYLLGRLSEGLGVGSVTAALLAVAVLGGSIWLLVRATR